MRSLIRWLNCLVIYNMNKYLITIITGEYTNIVTTVVGYTDDKKTAESLVYDVDESVRKIQKDYANFCKSDGVVYAAKRNAFICCMVNKDTDKYGLLEHMSYILTDSQYQITVTEIKNLKHE